MEYIIDKFNPLDNVVQLLVKKEAWHKCSAELKGIGAKIIFVTELENCNILVVEKDEKEKQIINIGFKYAKNNKARGQKE